MKPVNEIATPRGPQQSSKSSKSEIPSRTVFEFSISSNQFNVLQKTESAVSTSQGQSEDRLIDPRRTRLARQQAARTTFKQGILGTLSNEGIFHTVPPIKDEQGILHNRRVDQPVSSGIRPKFFPDSLSISPSDILEQRSGGNI